MKPFAAIAILIFSLIACAQLIRFLLRVEVIAGGISIPVWPSALASVIFGGLAYMIWLENRSQK